MFFERLKKTTYNDVIKGLKPVFFIKLFLFVFICDGLTALIALKHVKGDMLHSVTNRTESKITYFMCIFHLISMIRAIN